MRSAAAVQVAGSVVGGGSSFVRSISAILVLYIPENASSEKVARELVARALRSISRRLPGRSEATPYSVSHGHQSCRLLVLAAASPVGTAVPLADARVRGDARDCDGRLRQGLARDK